MDSPQRPMEKSTPALTPFDSYEFADVVLRSSDNYDFHVHKLVLSLSSPFFKQMFSLVQPTSSSPPPSTSPTHADSLPVIPVSEDHGTIDYLLRICYPIADPTPPKDVAVVAKILEVAMKYELEEATDILKGLLRRYIPEEPLRVFAHACRLRLEDVASEAATSLRARSQNVSVLDSAKCRNTIHTGQLSESTFLPCNDPDCTLQDFAKTKLGSTWAEEMKEISAGCFYRLIHFVRTGVVATFCDPPSIPSVASGSPSSGNTPYNVDPKILSLCPPDIVLRSSDSKLIHTYRLLLALGGAVELLEGTQCETTSMGGLSVVDVDADEAMIQNLLRTCHPCGFDATTSGAFSSDELWRLWGVAHRYGMVGAKQAIKLAWAHRIEDEPIGVYLAAMAHGWAEEAEKATTRSMSLPLFDQSGYAPEMEFVPADVLYDLF